MQVIRLPRLADVGSIGIERALTVIYCNRCDHIRQITHYAASAIKIQMANDTCHRKHTPIICVPAHLFRGPSAIIANVPNNSESD